MQVVGTELMLQIGRIPAPKFWLLAGAAVLATAAAFWFAFRWLTRARIIEDMPTSRIRSAPQGYVELNGEARMMEGEPLLAPLSNQPCCWFRYKVERRGDKGWHRVEGDTSDHLFLLADETGRCIVDPEGAEVTPETRRVWHGNRSWPDTAAPRPRDESTLLRVGRLLGRNAFGGGRYRYTEELILDSAPLYAIGEFKTLDELDYQQVHREIARDLLRHWKQDSAALLARFDRNGDGEVDEQEWDEARRLAQQEAMREQQAQSQHQIPHLLFRPTSSRPFLISTRPQFALASRYRWMAAAAAAGFLLIGGIATWLITMRLMG